MTIWGLLPLFQNNVSKYTGQMMGVRKEVEVEFKESVPVIVYFHEVLPLITHGGMNLYAFTTDVVLKLQIV